MEPVLFERLMKPVIWETDKPILCSVLRENLKKKKPVIAPKRSEIAANDGRMEQKALEIRRSKLFIHKCNHQNHTY